jgi:hypothetical protein
VSLWSSICCCWSLRSGSSSRISDHTRLSGRVRDITTGDAVVCGLQNTVCMFFHVFTMRSAKSKFGFYVDMQSQATHEPSSQVSIFDGLFLFSHPTAMRNTKHLTGKLVMDQ